MRKICLLIAIAPLALQAQIKYPVSAKSDNVDEYHGTAVPDPYRWLEDDRSAYTADWVTRQNKVTFDYLDQIPYRKQWQDRLEEINNYPKYSSPFRNNATLGRQTLAIDMTRALENGSYFVMAGNDNESFVIADTGNIVAISGDDAPNSSLNAEVQVHTYTTPFVRFGDYMLLIAGAFLLIVCVWLLT